MHGVTGRVSLKALRVINCMADTHANFTSRTWLMHPCTFPLRDFVGGVFLLVTTSRVLKSMQSLLIYLHCLGNAGLQKYTFGIKKMAANDSGVWRVISLLMQNLNLFRMLKMGFECSTSWALKSMCRSILFNVAELSPILGLHPAATTFSVHHPPAQGHTRDLDLKIKLPELNGGDSSMLVDCFRVFPPVTKHFPRSLSVASLHVYKHHVLLDL